MARNLENRKRYMTNYYHVNKEIILQQQSRYRKVHADTYRQISWAKRHILNSDGTPFLVIDFDRLYQIQKGRCKMCNRHSTELKRQLSVDHDHKTSIVRALICNDCNRALGLFQDDLSIIDQASQYMKSFTYE